MTRTATFLPACLLVLTALAQEQGRVRFFVDPGDDFSFVLDNKYRLQQREISLSPGPHTFTFWAPRHAMVDTSFTVIADSLSILTLRLPLSLEYIDHQRELHRFRRKQLLTRSLPAAATAGVGIWAVAGFFAYRNAHNDLQDLEKEYADLQVPRAIAQLKEQEIPAAKETFKDKRTAFFIAGGLFAAGLAGTIHAFRSTAHREVPVFEDKEKLRFEGLVWAPGAQGGTWAAGISLPLR